MRRWALGRQASSVAAGLLIAGLLTYIFLAIVARRLPAADLGTFGAVWSVLFFGGVVAYLGVEQTGTVWVAAAPAEARTTIPISSGRLLLLVSGAALATAAATILLVPGARSPAVFGIIVLAVAAYAPNYLLRAHLAGNQRFGLYGGLVAAETASRLLALAVVLTVTESSVEGFLLATAIGPLIAGAAFGGVIFRLRLSNSVDQIPLAAIGALGAANFALIGFLNIGPAIVTARGAEVAAAGVFLGFLIVRIPLFMFQSVTATLLPNASRLIAEEGQEHAWKVVRRGAAILIAGLAVLSIPAAVIGPAVLRLFFGRDGGLETVDILVLALGMSLTLGGLLLQQFHVAARDETRVLFGWVAAFAALIAVGFVAADPGWGVEIGFLIGGAAAAVLLLRPSRSTIQPSRGTR